MLPEVWTPADEQAHLEDCDQPLDITTLGEEPGTRLMCGCGEASRHTPMAVARAEVELLTTSV